MEADKKSLSEILSVDIRLVAPLFQRPYVWSQEVNWEPLWAALVEVFERRLTQADPRPYFLGALVLNQAPSPVGTVSCREIIDGQQRMTTLQIIMEQAKAVFLELGHEHHVKQLDRLTRNDLEFDSDEKFKVWPTNVDRDQFRAVMSNQETTGRMSEASEFFRERIRQWVGAGDPGTKERSTALLAAIKSDLVFVAIDLENDDDGQLIFETLNSLGTPLLPSDLVKNLLFRQASVERLDADTLFDKHWRQFEAEQGYWRGKVIMGRRERVQLDVFLQHYLAFKLGKEPDLSHQFRNYRDGFIDGKFGTTEEALADFARHAELYRQFDEGRLSKAGNDLRYALEVLDISVFNPLILGIISRVSDVTDRDRLLRVVESYVVRRFLCAVTTKNYNRLTAEAITVLNSEGWDPKVLATFFGGLEGRTVVWPTDEFVTARTCGKQAYGDIKRSGIAYVLGRIENAMRTEKTEVQFNTRTPLTVEHLMPQKWAANWPLGEVTKERRDELVDYFGNLTVLTKKLNSSVSNSAWIKKRGRLNDHTVLLMNSALALRETWDESDIEERTRHLAAQFCQLWPRP